MAGIKKEQDKATTANPVTTSRLNKDQRKYKPDISMSTEGNNTGSKIVRVLLLHVMEKLRTLEEASLSQHLPLPNDSVLELILSDYVFVCQQHDPSMHGFTQPLIS
eukprot:12525745-Ditylum_brightwellii.AAC.1